MKRHLIFIGLALLWATIAQAKLTAEVSETEISKEQRFKLTLTQDNKKDSEIPDLTPLQKEFNIIGTERSISYQFINGQASSLIQWVIILTPKKEGHLTIPPIKVGNETSSAITLNVTSTPASNKKHRKSKGSGKHVLLKTEISPEKPYVNQQITYTVKLYTNKSLLDADYQGPQVENALMLPLGQTKRYQSYLDGESYAVEEQKYALFPQQSGPITIQPPEFKALIYDVVPSRTKVSGKMKQLTVQPIPVKYKGTHWLPAKEVHLSESYNQLGPSLNPGDTLTRTIEIEAVQAPAQLLPRIKLQGNDQFKVYPQKPKEKNTIRQGELVGNSITKMTYLISKSGTIVLPEFRLHWFNTSTGKEEVAVLPPKTIHIKTAANQQNTTPPNSTTSQNQELKPDSNQKENKVIQTKNSNWLPWLLASFFALAWLITISLWIFQKNTVFFKKHHQKKVMKKLYSSCENNNIYQARDALLSWAKIQWPDRTLLNLADLSKIVHDVELKKQIIELSETLYSQNQNRNWRGEKLWNAIKRYQKTKYQRPKTKNSLPPINPIS